MQLARLLCLILICGLVPYANAFACSNVSYNPFTRKFACTPASEGGGPHTHPTSDIVSGILALARGGVGIDLSVTGGTSFVLQQTTLGGNVSVGQLAASDLSNGTSGSGAVILQTSPTITTPTVASFANANHTHQDSAGGGTLNASAISAGLLALARGGTNTDLSGTGGTNHVLRQSTLGGNLTTSQLAASNLSDGTTGSGSIVLASSPTITTPTIGSFANAAHSHQDAAGGGTLNASAIAAGTLALARGGTAADLSGTGGTSQVLRQSTLGGAVTVGQLAASNLSDGTTGTGTIVLSGSPTITTPTIGSFANSNHNHTNSAGGGQLTDAALSAAVTVAKGGTGITSGTSGGIPYFSGTGTIASSALLAQNGVVLGGGAGATPATTTAGSADQVFRVPGGGGAPAFGTVATAGIADGAVTTGKVTAALKTEIKSINIFDPTTADTGKVTLYFPLAVTTTRVVCSIDTGTSVTIQLDERAEATPNTTGTSVMTSSLVCDTNSEATTTFSNAGIASRVPVVLLISAVSGTPTVLRVHMEYTID